MIPLVLGTGRGILGVVGGGAVGLGEEGGQGIRLGGLVGGILYEGGVGTGEGAVGWVRRRLCMCMITTKMEMEMEEHFAWKRYEAMRCYMRNELWLHR